MATEVSFIDLAQLAALLKKPVESLGDDYTKLVIGAVEELIRDEAEQPGWVGKDPGPGQSLAPQRARYIGLWTAKRVWEEQSNRGRLQRRTAGPISETFFEGGLSGLELSDADLAWLRRQSARSRGLWVQPVGTRAHDYSIYLNDENPLSDPILIDDGSTGWVYGEPTLP